MKIIGEIAVDKERKLQILKGDLTKISKENAVDILVVSAFEGDYAHDNKSLIGALWHAGLSVENLSDDKEIDLREQFSCWLSKEINFKNIKRILCFEPPPNEEPYNLIAGIFKSIMPFAIPYSIETVAMPLVLTGDRGYSAEAVIKELINTSLLWLSHNSPLKTIKIVVKDDDQKELLKNAFEAQKLIFYKGTKEKNYDFFISYSRKNAPVVKIIYENLKNKFHLFFDTESIDTGENWLAKINVALKNSDRFIICISPEYIKSNFCKEEYQRCYLRFMNQKDRLLPIKLYKVSLPDDMAPLNNYDARPPDRQAKLEEFCKRQIKKYAVNQH